MNADYIFILFFAFPICFSIGLFFIIGAIKDLPVLMQPKEREGVSSSFFTSTFWISIRESFGELGLKVYHCFVGVIFILIPVLILVLTIKADIQDFSEIEQESLAEYQVDIGQRINGTWSTDPDSIKLQNSDGIIIQDYSWGKGYIKPNESLVIDLDADKPFLNPDSRGPYSDGIGKLQFITEVEGRKDNIKVVYELPYLPGKYMEVVFLFIEPNVMRYRNVSKKTGGFREGGILYRNSGPDYYRIEE